MDVRCMLCVMHGWIYCWVVLTMYAAHTLRVCCIYVASKLDGTSYATDAPAAAGDEDDLGPLRYACPRRADRAQR